MQFSDLIKSLVSAGPFAVLVSILVVVAARWQDIPPVVLEAALLHLPWVVVVMTLLWLVVWLANTHKQERKDLVESLSKMHTVIETNTAALGRIDRFLAQADWCAKNSDKPPCMIK